MTTPRGTCTFSKHTHPNVRGFDSRVGTRFERGPFSCRRCVSIHGIERRKRLTCVSAIHPLEEGGRMRWISLERESEFHGAGSRRSEPGEASTKTRFVSGTNAFVAKSPRTRSLGIVGRRVLLLSPKSDDHSSWIVYVPCFGIAVVCNDDLAPCALRGGISMPGSMRSNAGSKERFKEKVGKIKKASYLGQGHILATHSTSTVLGIAGMKAHLLEIPRPTTDTSPRVLVCIENSEETFCISQNEFCQDTGVPEEALPWWTMARSTKETRRLGIEGEWILVLPGQRAMRSQSQPRGPRKEIDDGKLPVWSKKTSLVLLDFSDLEVNKHTPLHMLYTVLHSADSTQSGSLPFHEWWKRAISMAKNSLGLENLR